MDRSNRLVCLALALFVLSSCGGESPTPPETPVPTPPVVEATYRYPLEVGNRWTYVSTRVTKSSSQGKSVVVDTLRWEATSRVKVGQDSGIWIRMISKQNQDTTGAAYSNRSEQGVYLLGVDSAYHGGVALRASAGIRQASKRLLPYWPTRDSVWLPDATNPGVEKRVSKVDVDGEEVLRVRTFTSGRLTTEEDFGSKGLRKRHNLSESFVDALTGDTLVVEDSLVLVGTEGTVK